MCEKVWKDLGASGPTRGCALEPKSPRVPWRWLSPDDMIWINRLAWTSRFGSISITPRSEDHARINLYLTVSRRCQNTRWIYFRDKDLDKKQFGRGIKTKIFSIRKWYDSNLSDGNNHETHVTRMWWFLSHGYS